MSAPAPLTPADSDLSKFPYMPLDVARLRSSDLAALSSAEAFRAAVLLWCAAWHQKPAASLPDDDRVLAQLAGFGRFEKQWKKVRAEALRGFVKCSDGRLYHSVIAEKAMDALKAKDVQRQRTEAARTAKTRKGGSDGGGQQHGQSQPPPQPKKPPVTGDANRLSQQTEGNCNNGAETPVTASNREGIEKERPESRPPPPEPKPSARASSPKLPWVAVVEAVSHPWLDPNKTLALVTEGPLVSRWIADGADLDLDVIPTVKDLIAKLAPAEAPVRTWKYFTAAVRRNTAARLGAEQQTPDPIKPEEARNGHSNGSSGVGGGAAPGAGARGLAGAAFRAQARRAAELDSGRDDDAPESDRATA